MLRNELLIYDSLSSSRAKYFLVAVSVAFLRISLVAKFARKVLQFQMEVRVVLHVAHFSEFLVTEVAVEPLERLASLLIEHQSLGIIYEPFSSADFKRPWQWLFNRFCLPRFSKGAWSACRIFRNTFLLYRLRRVTVAIFFRFNFFSHILLYFWKMIIFTVSDRALLLKAVWICNKAMNLVKCIVVLPGNRFVKISIRH